MIAGTGMAMANHFKGSIYALHIGGTTISAYAAIYALIVNIVVTVVLHRWSSMQRALASVLIRRATRIMTMKGMRKAKQFPLLASKS